MDVEFGTHERADVAQLAERVLGKDEVTGSIPVIGSSRHSDVEVQRRFFKQSEYIHGETEV